MKHVILIKTQILNFINNKGYHLLKDSELDFKMTYFKNVLKLSKKKKLNNKIDSIIFSKDRAMQLHTFLRSFIEMVDNRGTLYILYRTTSERHKKSYQDLKKIFKNEDFIFIEESDFRKQLIEVCQLSNAKIIGFYVDDMIFTHKIDYNHILEFDTLDYVVSIGRGRDLDYNIVLSKPNIMPEFLEMENGFLRFNWNFIKEKNDFTFPLGVGGYFYGNEEINVMLDKIIFKAPNSLEINLQYFKPFFINRFGVCKDKTVSVAVHANLVQTEQYNPTLESFSIEKLLELWENKMQINLSDFYGKDGAEAQFQKYIFEERD